MFQVEKLQSKREDTIFGRKKVYYVDGIRVISGFDPELLSTEELQETKKAAGNALDRLDELREQNKPDRSNWPLYGAIAITILLTIVSPLPALTSELVFGWAIIALLTALYPVLKLLLTHRFLTLQVEVNEIFTQCAIELAKRNDP